MVARRLSQGLRLNGDSRVALTEDECGEPAGSQVVVRTHAVGLCGSDMSLFRGTYQGPRNYPIYFGHEWSGVVEAVGPQVTTLHPGDRVTGDCSLYCGVCEFCAHDKNLCRDIEKFGITTNGASRCYFLQDERYLYRAEADADLDLVALSEPLAVGAKAVQRVRDARPALAREKVLVLGAGAVGLACLLALRYLHGVEHVAVHDVGVSRLKRAQQLGAAPAPEIDGRGDNASYAGLYSGKGYDAIFETSGSPQAFRAALDLLRPMGVIMQLGFISSVDANLRLVTLKAAQVMGSMGGTGQFPQVLAFTREHPELARPLISHRIPYREAERAFAAAADPEQALKVLITFQ